MADRINSLYWFRRDLRLQDNPALTQALENGPAVFVYIFDEESKGIRALGGAQKVWLHDALDSLRRDLHNHHVELILRKGRADKIIPEIVNELGIQNVFWNRCYDKGSIDRDKKLKATLKQGGLDVETFNASLLFEPWEIKNKSGDYFKVFTPHWKALLAKDAPRKPLPAPSSFQAAKPKIPSDKLEGWCLIPEKPDWSRSMRDFWDISEQGAHDRLQTFLEDYVDTYNQNRNRPDLDNTSRLSPYLHFGLISPQQIWHTACAFADRHHGGRWTKGIESFLRELGWREFCYNVLYHFPGLADQNFQEKFDNFPWKDNEKALAKWQQGQTGYPIVDAGMRQLWAIGWMHNRVRMIVASLLIKHLLIDWRKGEQWFWDTLVDADHANNAAGWQWVAGSGTDAAPFFRIFNPFTQGEKFDPNGDYVRHWVPELNKMPTKYIHRPWETPKDVLTQIGVTLGKTYPKPIVEHFTAREKALEIFQSLK